MSRSVIDTKVLIYTDTLLVEDRQNMECACVRTCRESYRFVPFSTI